jgi:hypothetical protein
VERTGAHSGDEAWIEKYRDAMQNTPVEKRRFEELRKVVESLRKVISAYVKKFSVGPAETAKEGGKTGSSVPIGTSGIVAARKGQQPPVEKLARRKVG